jgi:hypothetical protein
MRGAAKSEISFGFVMSVERVDIFIAGVQKAATTALHAYLSGHPDIVSADAKELHFFDNEKIDWSAPDYSLLHNRYPAPRSGQIAIDATPIYSFWPSSLKRIQDYNSGAKIIIQFRDPIERAWAHWRMIAAQNAENLSFSQSIRDGRKRLDPSTRLADNWRFISYVERGFYAGQVRRLFKVFPKEQILLLRSNDLEHTPETSLSRVTEFIGIDSFGRLDTRRENVGSDRFGTIPESDVLFLRDIYQDDVREFASLTGLDVSDWPAMNPDIPIR